MAAKSAATPAPKARADISTYPLDNDLVLYDTMSREGFILNSTAAKVWQLADGSRTPAAMARAMAKDYGVEYKSALGDVRELLTALDGAGLLSKPGVGCCPDE